MSQSQNSKQANTAILSTHEDGGIAIICAGAEKILKNSDKRTSWKSERSEKVKSSPACCRRSHEYPPGYTVFECRLDGNQPIAQVVQVPSDTTDNVIQNKTCMLLETRQSECGPSSRVVAYPTERTSFKRRKPPTEPMFFGLESRDCPGGAVARAEKVSKHVDEHSPICSTRPVTILETTKGRTCRNGPSARLVYGPVSQDPEKSSPIHETPGFYIHCSTTRDGPIARVTQVPPKFLSSSGDSATNYEAHVNHDGSCPTATVTRCNDRDEICRGACESLETRVDDSGPRATATTLPERFSNLRHFTNLDVRPHEDGPCARISQCLAQPGDVIPGLRNNEADSRNSRCCHQSSPVNCRPGLHKPTRIFGIDQAGVKPALNIRRRNGLTPTRSEQQGRVGLVKNGRMKKARISEVSKSCPAYCCRPVSSPSPASPVCRVQPAPCATNMSPALVARPKSGFPRSGSCLCPTQMRCNVTDHPFSEMRPLPGGTFVPQYPPPSLPEIAPVQLGPNRLRVYEPLPKKSGPRKTKSASPSRRGQPPRIDRKSDKPAGSVVKKKKKNKEDVPSVKPGKPLKTAVESKDQESNSVSDESSVESPTFASKAVQFGSVCAKPSDVESKGNQTSPVHQKPSNRNQAAGPSQEDMIIECPAFKSSGTQSVCVRERPTIVECPAFKSDGTQSVCVSERPTIVECPAFKSDGTQSVCVRDEPMVVQCPAFKSDGTQSVRVRDEPKFVQCPAFKSDGTQSVRVCERPTIVQCPAFKSDGTQSVCVRDEPTVVQCPAFKSKAIQSVCVRERPTIVDCPAFKSDGTQSVRVRERPTIVECPAFKSDGTQSVRVRDEPTFVQCPAFKSKAIQSVCVRDEPSHIECPGIQSRNSQLGIVAGEASRVKQFETKKSNRCSGDPENGECPAVASGKSSDTSSVYVSRKDASANKYSEHFRTKTLGNCVSCCAKRNRVHQVHCPLHVPETVVRISYEQRRNRQARTILSSGSGRHRFEDEVNEIRKSYCVRA